jgi:hypothetical protein
MAAAEPQEGGFKRNRFGEPILSSPGGAPLAEADKKTIVFQYFVNMKAVADIAQSIPSPRVAGAHICERSVCRVLDMYIELGDVYKFMRKKRVPKMLDLHSSTLMEIVEENPWLFLDEIAAELCLRCGINFHGKQCYDEMIGRGYSLKVIPALRVFTLPFIT